MVLNKSAVIFTILLFFNSSLYSYIRTNLFFVDFGNTFTHECVFTGGDLGAHNGTSFVYNHHTNSITTPVCTTATVDPNSCSPPIQYIKQTACPSHFTAPRCDYEEMITQVGTVSATITSKELLIDGGNTQGLITMIQQQPNAGTVKNALLAASPYLSDAVMIEYIKKNHPYPPGNLLQVMLANSPLTDTVLNALINRQPPLPPGILNQILAAQNGTSARAELEAEIDFFTQQLELAYGGLKRIFMNDTTFNGIDSVIAVLQEEGGVTSTMQLADAYLRTGNITQAQAMLDSLQSVPGFENFIALKQMEISLLQQGQNWFQAVTTDSTLRQQIESIADDTLQYGYVEARALLGLLYGIEFPLRIDPLNLPSAKKGNTNGNNTIEQPENINGIIIEETPPDKETSERQYHHIAVYPNPANDIITFDYNLPDSIHHIELIIYNLLGQAKAWERVNHVQGYKKIITSALPVGLYFWEININGVSLTKKKLVIIR